MREVVTTPPPKAVLEQADWHLIDRNAAAAAIGVSRSTFNAMIKQRIVPDGVEILARTKMWRVGEIRDLAERMYRGEFSGVKLWENAKKVKKAS
jgi:predicted DNA-binding transcriptional regulator AlpA